jgi:O-antigen/teichoic acid export membrane protein
MSLAAAPASGILLPAFARAETDRARTRRVFQTTARLAGLAAFPLAAALFVTAGDLIPLLFGGRYAGAADYVRLLSFALALELMLMLPSNALALTNAAVLRPYVAVRIAVLVLGGAYVLLDDVDLLWMAAWMIGVRLASVAGLHVIIARRTGIRLEYRWIARLVAATAASTITGAATAAVISARPASALAAGAVLLATFAVALRVAGLLRPDDLALLRRIVPVRTPVTLPSSDPR